MQVESPEFEIFDWDNDYGINLLLQNTAFGVTQVLAAGSQPYGELVAENPSVTNPPVSLETKGYPSNSDCGPPDELSATLHVEFEGAGVYDWLQISQGLLAFAIAALLACLFLPPPFNLIVGMGLAIMAALAWLIGSILAKVVRRGDPSDVNPAVTTIQENEKDKDTQECLGADILYVKGTWVFDPLHAGWNELHPVKVCTKVGTWDGEWSDLPPDLILRARHGFDIADSDETRGNQSLPEHQWQVHPHLDGCTPPVVIE